MPIDAARLRELRSRVKEAKSRDSPDSKLLDDLLREIEANVGGHISKKGPQRKPRKP